MLSKLRHPGVAIHSIPPSNAHHLSAQIEAQFGSTLTELRRCNGGTSGISFIGKLSGQTRFFKTYSIPSGRVSLTREELFLKATSGERTDAHSFVVKTSQEERLWLNMKALQPSGALTPTAVLTLVAEQERSLNRLTNNCPLVHKHDDINYLVSEATLALSSLSELQLLSHDIQQKAQHYLKQLHLTFADWPRQLCHGDFGPENILSDAKGLVAIDWEDAIWGVQGYDYLYWLTFFDNRKWLSSKVLGQTSLGSTKEVAVMIMILLLKSALSIRNGSYLNNTISINQRLLEVLELDE